MSAGEGVFEEVVREANVFERGRKGDDDCGGEDATWAVGEAGWEEESAVEASDAADCDLPDMGTVSPCRFEFEACGDSGDMVFVSSAGISSAAGIGRPLPAATS